MKSIATCLGVTIAAVHNRLYRAHRYFADNLDCDRPLIELWKRRARLLREYCMRCEPTSTFPGILLRTQGAEFDHELYLEDEILASLDEVLGQRNRELQRIRQSDAAFIIRMTLVDPNRLTSTGLANLQTTMLRDLGWGMRVIIRFREPGECVPSLDDLVQWLGRGHFYGLDERGNELYGSYLERAGLDTIPGFERKRGTEKKIYGWPSVIDPADSPEGKRIRQLLRDRRSSDIWAYSEGEVEHVVQELARRARIRLPSAQGG